MASMMDYYAALAQLQATLPPVDGQESLPLAQACGRTLLADLPARHDAPRFDNSAMDGYAIADPEQSLMRFALYGRTAAGEYANVVLQPGQARRVFTGAPVPAGTSAVVAQEHAREQDGVLLLSSPVPCGLNVRYRAEEFAAGAPLLPAGQLLSPAALALAASQGYADLTVRRVLKVALFSSGNELCEPGSALRNGKIYDANRYLLQAWLSKMPLQLIDAGILPDDAQHTRQRLAAMAQQVDVILTSGGASVGEEDHLKQALSALGRLDSWKMAIKPGKPFAWGQLGAARVFMLPGNPVATLVTFHLLVAPALRRLMGATSIAPPSWRARATFTRGGNEARRQFLRASISTNAEGDTQVTALAAQGSAMLAACVSADVLVELPPETPVALGDWLRVYPLQ